MFFQSQDYSPTHSETVPEESQELNKVYSNDLVDCLEFGVQLGCPSVRKHVVRCLTKSVVKLGFNIFCHQYFYHAFSILFCIAFVCNVAHRYG